MLFSESLDFVLAVLAVQGLQVLSFLAQVKYYLQLKTKLDQQLHLKNTMCYIEQRHQIPIASSFNLDFSTLSKFVRELQVF